MDDKTLKLLVRQLCGNGALAWSWKKDDSLVVIKSDGAKQHYTAEVCRLALKELEAKRKGKANDQRE